MIKYTENALNIITLLTYKRITRRVIYNSYKNQMSDEDMAQILQQNKCNDTDIDVSGIHERKQLIEKFLYAKYSGDLAVSAISFVDEVFPQFRANCEDKDRAVVLFYAGDISLLEKECVAVIGVLNPSIEVAMRERNVVHELVAQNKVIVSGLAKGCDAISHQVAIEENGYTIAILPSPLYNIQPAINKKLAQDILAYGGLLITEYWRDPRYKQEAVGRYIERDRLQALFADCVILTASYDVNNLGNDCGSRHALQVAADNHIKRAIIYNEECANDSQYDLSRRILREDGNRCIVIDPNDIDITSIPVMKPQKTRLQVKQTELFG